MASMLDHCEAVYRALEERATIKDDELVFAGGITEVYTSLGISHSYYSKVFQRLEDAGAILKLQRGGRGVDTVIVLRGLPESWPEPLRLTNGTRSDTVLREVQEIKESIGGLNIKEALLDLETRLSKLEAVIARKV